MQSLIIHMASATARKGNVETLLKALPGARVIAAENGEGHTSHPGDLHWPHYPFAMGKGEIGCLRSHRKCWQWIVDNDVEFALIAEDDLSLDPDLWQDVLTLIERHATAEHFIRLPAKTRETPAHTLDQQGASRLFLPKVIGLQTVFQAVGKSAAARLLHATEEFDRPVDTFLQMHWVHQQPIHTILPNGVSELTAALGGSTIQKKSRTSRKLMREFRRFFYRRAVTARPQAPH